MGQPAEEHCGRSSDAATDSQCLREVCRKAKSDARKAEASKQAHEAEAAPEMQEEACGVWVWSLEMGAGGSVNAISAQAMSSGAQEQSAGPQPAEEPLLGMLRAVEERVRSLTLEAERETLWGE